MIDSNPDTRSIIYPIFQFFTRFEKWELFGTYGNFVTGFRVSARVTFVFFYKKAAQSPDFDTLAPGPWRPPCYRKIFEPLLQLPLSKYSLLFSRRRLAPVYSYNLLRNRQVFIGILEIYSPKHDKMSSSYDNIFGIISISSSLTSTAAYCPRASILTMTRPLPPYLAKVPTTPVNGP